MGDATGSMRFARAVGKLPCQGARQRSAGPCRRRRSNEVTRRAPRYRFPRSLRPGTCGAYASRVETECDQLQREGESRVGATLVDKWHLDALIGIGGTAAVFAAT